MNLRACIVLSSCTLLSVGCCLNMCRGGLRPPYLLMTLGFCIVLSSYAILSVGCRLVMFEGGLRPPYSLMTLGFCIVLSSCALLLVGAVLSFEWVATNMVAATREHQMTAQCRTPGSLNHRVAAGHLPACHGSTRRKREHQITTQCRTPGLLKIMVAAGHL